MMEYLQRPAPRDHLFDLYLESWLIYYRTADSIDGHIKSPRNAHEAKLMNIAKRTSDKAQAQFLSRNGISNMYGITDREKWSNAKEEAWRTVEREKPWIDYSKMEQ